jgi:hypothetical protein
MAEVLRIDSRLRTYLIKELPDQIKCYKSVRDDAVDLERGTADLQEGLVVRCQF